MVMIVIAVFGFFVIDVAYAAVFFNYSIRCELMIDCLQSICTRVKNKEWEIDKAIKVYIIYICTYIHTYIHPYIGDRFCS